MRAANKRYQLLGRGRDDVLLSNSSIHKEKEIPISLPSRGKRLSVALWLHVPSSPEEGYSLTCLLSLRNRAGLVCLRPCCAVTFRASLSTGPTHLHFPMVSS